MTLDPLTAAKLADAVYGIRTTTNIAQGILDRGVRGLDADWDLAGGSVAAGRSGAGAFNARSGFGLVLNGRNGDRVVAIRGTVNAYDWLSNMIVATDRGPNGYLVHAGFHRVYVSMIGQVLSALGSDRLSPVHVVGHSLGGAIANNVAARLHADGYRNLGLYTFGAPRPGLVGFASALTSALGAGNIHRVYHLADPVPMVPIFPFGHPPARAEGLRVGGSTGAIAVDAHYMSSYAPLVANHTWLSLERASAAMEIQRGVDYWLRQAAERCSIPGGALALWVLGKALQALIDTAVASLGLVVLASATLIDTVASLLSRAADLSAAIADRVMSLMSSVMRWAGRGVVAGAQLTTQFIAYVLGLILFPLTSIARRALEVMSN